MQKIIYAIANVFYKIFNILPIDNNQIVMECEYGKGFYGNIDYIYQEILNRNLDYKIVVPLNKNVQWNRSTQKNVKLIKTRSLAHLYYLATSKYWITDNHYYYFLKPRKKTIFINTWHALGAFKKFGLHSAKIPSEITRFTKEGENVDYLLVSSYKLREIYSEALNVSKEKVISIGIPRTDQLFNIDSHNFIKAKFYEKYQGLKNKKIVLYAPTFRDHEKKHFNMKLDIEKFISHLGEDVILLIKLHPIVANNYNIPMKFQKNVIDVKDENINELMILADILVTDYSSLIFEFALLKKPIIFYAYDYKIYSTQLRGFYYNYEEFVPGPIAETTDSVVDLIKKNEFNLDEVVEFSQKFCEFQDGNSTKRFVEKFL